MAHHGLNPRPAGGALARAKNEHTDRTAGPSARAPLHEAWRHRSSAETSSEALRAKLSARWRSPPFKARVDCAKNVRASSSVLPSAPESLTRLSLAIRRRTSSCNPWIWRRRAVSSAELSRGSREGTWGVGGGSVVSGVFSVSPAGGSVRSTRRGRRADSGGEVG
jgi:hypothetical protein